jgi:hypothetical protein
MAIFDQKDRKKFSAVFFSYFLIIKTLNPDSYPGSLEMMDPVPDPYPDSMNPDP